MNKKVLFSNLEGQSCQKLWQDRKDLLSISHLLIQIYALRDVDLSPTTKSYNNSRSDFNASQPIFEEENQNLIIGVDGSNFTLLTLEDIVSSFSLKFHILYFLLIQFPPFIFGFGILSNFLSLIFIFQAAKSRIRMKSEIFNQVIEEENLEDGIRCSTLFKSKSSRKRSTMNSSKNSNKLLRLVDSIDNNNKVFHSKIRNAISVPETDSKSSFHQEYRHRRKILSLSQIEFYFSSYILCCLITLLISLFPEWLFCKFFQHSISNTNIIFCRLWNWLQSILFSMPVWILIPLVLKLSMILLE